MARTKQAKRGAKMPRWEKAIEQAGAPGPAPVIRGASAFRKWVERLDVKVGKGDADGERLRIAMIEALGAPGPHGRKDGTALSNALHCMRLVEINVRGGLERDPEGVLVYLATALQSLEALVDAVLEEIVPAEAEAGLRAMRRARRAA